MFIRIIIIIFTTHERQPSGSFQRYWYRLEGQKTNKGAVEKTARLVRVDETGFGRGVGQRCCFSPTPFNTYAGIVTEKALEKARGIVVPGETKKTIT